MRIPKKPPSWKSVFKRPDESLLRRAVEPAIRAAVDTANDRAWNYEECKYRTPAGLSRDEFWTLVKLSRASGREAIPLLDLRGHPFDFRLPGAAHRILHIADKEMAGSIAATAAPELDSLESRKSHIIRSLMEEAIASSRIEGAAVTRDDAEKMLRENRKPRTEGERMIRNNYATIRMVNERRDEPMTPEFLREIQRNLTLDTLKKPDQAGRFRRADERIDIRDERDDEVMHVPPPAGELPRRIDALCAFANSGEDPRSTDRFLHPVIRAIALHFWVGYDHPFADGNGRTARALFYWSMLRSGYWLVEYLTISEIIHGQPIQYGRAFLDTEIDDNDLTYFIAYHLGVLERSLKAFRDSLLRRTADRAQLVAAVSLARFNPRQREVLAQATRDASAAWSYEALAQRFGVTVPTARADLLSLERLGLLKGNRVGRRFEFVPVRDLGRVLRELEPAD
jgi:Fic family protein